MILSDHLYTTVAVNDVYFSVFLHFLLGKRKMALAVSSSFILSFLSLYTFRLFFPGAVGWLVVRQRTSHGRTSVKRSYCIQQ